MPRRSQLDLPLRERHGWGGRRKNAGRKSNGARPLVSRKARPQLNGQHPVHATLRALPEIPSLRVLNGWVKRALVAGADQPGSRVVYFSIQGNHLHLIVEADDAVGLSRGMQGLAVRIARAVNQAISRKRGKVFSDRYHEHVLTTPREARAAIAYLVENFRRHCEQSGRSLRPDFIDEHSSAIHLAGLETDPLPAPRFWLLSCGAWLMGPLEVGRFRVMGTG
jgi:putative transposase